MAIEVKQQQPDSVHLVIDGEVSIYNVSELKQALSNYLDTVKEMQIDLAGVAEIDGAGVQLLMFLKQEAAAKRVELSLARHSEAVVEVLELLNLSTHFGDPIVISADWKSL
ncbi:STAS domain-containing protein [Methylomonas sp. SURF-1]|uniref:STAS domain-containing protein n=1 Tax=Methylomonas aurea TaxID=2952224 RepID=A0ABT1UDY6_9GAMM|nr:STAS domain-containing protein [Methylomonas sp. SURF-1]MCQ8179900.1 STAS domain-containing protein [Methylomonas sp. SURF-1]